MRGLTRARQATRLLGIGNATVFRPGRDSPATRIPALARTGAGTLLALAELRATRADTGRIAIGLRRSLDGGASWGALIRVAEEGNSTARNPVPVVLASGRILLISCLDRVDRTGSPLDPTRVQVRHSDDDGLSWSEPLDITEQVREPGWRWYATGPGSVAPLASGRIVIPANHSRGGVHRAHALLSDDEGATWRLGGTVESALSNEGQLAQRADGSVLLYLRTRAPGGKEFAVSDDEGASWRPGPAALELAGPVCQSDLIAIGDELFATAHRHPTQRRGLGIRRSRDGGETWPEALRLVVGPAGYSDLVALDGDLLGVLFERGHRIVFRAIDRASIH